ncbi:MAG: acyl-CoA synthetase FdrA [Negativicutes bacterium]|nr:acyl-CoA synthetase FdrA [Negativicutes bacterium]
MAIQIIIKKNAYHDSVTLMSISGKVAALSGVADAVVAMATAMNKELLRNIGMLTPAVEACGSSDLVIAVKAESEEICAAAVKMAEEAFAQKAAVKKNAGETVPSTLQSAVKELPGANLAIISVPGEYAAREAMQALKQGLHVMMFSDNVTIEDEKKLKEYAHAAGLLMMGPDCGTAIINNVGLCFANAVNQGTIGIVGASGTGTQEVSVLIDRFGGGVSQVLGTGGRDLTEAIGGITMLDGLAALNADEATKVIVLVSKPPAKSVAEKILAEAGKCIKPVVVCFINASQPDRPAEQVYFAASLEDAAYKAVKLAQGQTDFGSACDHAALKAMAASRKAKLAPGQKYVRGLFCGGTLCDEAMYIVKEKVGTVYSNIAKQPEAKLGDPHTSKEHTFIDLGDDAFTVGKPHPMIEPSRRLPRLLQEAKDPAVAVILMDIMIGYGSHSDPAGITLPAIIEAKRIAEQSGRHLEIIAYVCGTDKDPQNRLEQEQKLAAAGVTLAKSNARAAYLAAAIVS